MVQSKGRGTSERGFASMDEKKQREIASKGGHKQIHAEYFHAGADIAIPNTFRTTPRAFRKLGRESEAGGALRNAVSVTLKAKEKTCRQVFVAGSFAPLEDCYRPDLVPCENELRKEML